MVNIKNPLFSVLSVCLALNMTSCGVDLNKLVEQQKLEVEPSPLELHGDSIGFRMSAIVPLKQIKKGYTYKLGVAYKPTNSEPIDLGSIQILGGDNKFAGLTSDPRIGQNFSFAYEDALASGDVVLTPSIQKTGREAKLWEGGTLEVAKGVITTSRLVRPTYFVNFIPSQYKSIEEYERRYTEFRFKQGSSELSRREKRSDNGQGLTNYIVEKNPTRTINITGMHSPEGSEQINSELAQERPQAMQEFIKKTAEKYDYKDQAEGINFVNKPVVQDWTEFKQALNGYEGVSEDQKNEIFAVIDGAGDFVSKELKLQTLRSYRKVFNDIYPGLRTARAEILRIKDKKPDAELVAIAQKIVRGEAKTDTLTINELNYAGDLTPSLEEKEAIYKMSIDQDDRFYAYNNLGATYLAMAKKASAEPERNALIDKAIAQLELSVKKQENPEAYVNLAGANLMKGNLEGALEAASKVSATGTSVLTQNVNAIKGYVDITKGNYDNAIATLSAAGNDPVVLYNKGLAYLLKASKDLGKDGYEKAKVAFDEAVAADQNNAYAHYGSAILAARMSDANKLGSSLKKAAELSANLKARAVTDLEFAKYFDNEAFTAALK